MLSGYSEESADFIRLNYILSRMSSETTLFHYCYNGLYRLNIQPQSSSSSIHAGRCFFYTPAYFVITSYTLRITIRITRLVRSLSLPVDANFECIISSGLAFIKSSTPSDVSCSIYIHASTYAGYRRFRACFTHVSEANGNSIPPYWYQIRKDPHAFWFYAFVIVL